MKQKVRVLIFTLIVLFQTIQSIEFCDQFELEVSGSVIIEGGMANHAGENFKILYDIETDDSGTSKLKAYRANQVFDSDNSLIQIDIEEFETDANADDQIAQVSTSGDCIVIDQGDSLTAYTTSSGAFVNVQNLSVATYSKIHASDSCNILEIITEAGENEIYVNGQKLETEVLPDSNTVFEETFRFGFNGNGKLYEYSVDNESFSVSQVTGLLDQVLEVKMRDNSVALLVLSRSTSGLYSIDVFDVSTLANVFSRTWDSSEVSGTPVLATQSGMKTVMLRDDNGMLAFLRIRNVNNSPSVINVQTENSDQNEALTKVNMVSLGRNFLVTYGSESINYFQIQSVDSLVYLGSYTFNMVEKRNKLASSVVDEYVVYIMVDPIVTDACEEDLTEDEQDDLDDDDQEDVEDEDGDVLECPAACIRCNANAFCQKCEPGYVVKNGLCVQCNGCKTCNPNRPSRCFSCFAHQTYDSSAKTCTTTVNCPSNCLNCDDGGNCLNCAEYHYLVNNACELCEVDGCVNCDSDPFTCDTEQCGESFVYYEGNCVECVTGCLSCSTTDLSNCTGCMPGFFEVLDETQNPVAHTCVECLTNCETCSSESSCSACFDGYKTNSDGTECVLECSSLCLTCVENQPDQCLSCRYGFEFDSDAQTCEINLVCNLTATCKSCPTNYAIDENQCFACESSDPNCEGCHADDLTTCVACSAGFYLQSGTCQSCSAACTSCTDNTLCFSCQDGFYLLKQRGASLNQGYCEACESPCVTCFRAPDVCRSCEDGYTLRNRKCLSDVRVIWEVRIIITNNIFVLISESLFGKIRIEIESRLPSFGFGKNRYFMDNSEDGSTVVSGAVSASSETQATIEEAVNVALTPGDNVDGYLIESSSVSSSTQVTTDDTTTEQESSSNMIWILAVVIPLAILLIAGIAWFVLRIRRKKEEIGKTDSLGQTNKALSNDFLSYEETDKI